MNEAIGASWQAGREDALRIAILAAGAGGMYCGSCLRDNALAGALRRAGHHVTLVPMYTPLRTEDGSVAIADVYYGGVNVYLQHRSPLFRHTPRPLHWLLDRPGVLKLAGKLGAQTPPAQLGPLTLSVLAGEAGPAVVELRRLADFLKADVRPQIVSLPNLMFIGLARTLREELGVAVVCELTGEDLFLGQLAEPHRSEAQRMIRDRVRDVSAFVATSSYYADEMARYIGVDRSRIAVVHPGVPVEYLADQSAPLVDSKAPSPAYAVGYFARVCPEKGFGQIVEAYMQLKRLPGLEQAELYAGGYLGQQHRPWFDQLMQNKPGVTFFGELDRASKLSLLDSLDVFSVPSVYAEAKGIYVLEALARGVPVVQPAHGSFPEVLELTGGGILTPPGDLAALAGALAELLRDPDRRAALGRAGRDAVRDGFTDDHMARKMLGVYRDALRQQTTTAA